LVAYEQLVMTISTERQGDRIVIRSSDNGVGIPEAIQIQIFDPFFTTKLVGYGTGMGG
jgi:signal transduction histidine kinase